MSKASRMFRSRSNRGANLAVRPVPELDVPTFSEADLSACLAALYNSPAGTSPHDFAAGTISDSRFGDQVQRAGGSLALLSFTSKTAAQPLQPDEVLAVLH